MKMMVEYHFVQFPKRRNYSRGIGDALHFSKTKVSSCQLEKTNKTLETPNVCVFAFIPMRSSLEGNEGNVGEIWGSIEK